MAEATTNGDGNDGGDGVGAGGGDGGGGVGGHADAGQTREGMHTSREEKADQASTVDLAEQAQEQQQEGVECGKRRPAEGEGKETEKPWQAGRVKGDYTERVRVVQVGMKLILLLLLPFPSQLLDKHIMLQSPPLQRHVSPLLAPPVTVTNSGTVSDYKHTAVISASSSAGLLLDVLCSLLQATATQARRILESTQKSQATAMQGHRMTHAYSMQTRAVAGGLNRREASCKGDIGGVLTRGLEDPCGEERKGLRRFKRVDTSQREVGEGHWSACGVIEVLGLLCGWAVGKGTEEESGLSGEGRSGSRGSECGRKEGEEEQGERQRVNHKEQSLMLEQGNGIVQDTAGRVRAGGGVPAGAQVEGMDVEGRSDEKNLGAVGGAQALLLHCCQQCVLLSIALAELADKAADVGRRDADVSASGFDSLSDADVAGSCCDGGDDNDKDKVEEEEEDAYDDVFGWEAPWKECVGSSIITEAGEMDGLLSGRGCDSMGGGWGGVCHALAAAAEMLRGIVE
ncbi:unnamed protein product [Closterium sp. Naga37s-1]|nr:unnamed protein product [Closterium sp. Naga37s-1]